MGAISIITYQATCGLVASMVIAPDFILQVCRFVSYLKIFISEKIKSFNGNQMMYIVYRSLFRTGTWVFGRSAPRHGLPYTFMQFRLYSAYVSSVHHTYCFILDRGALPVLLKFCPSKAYHILSCSSNYIPPTSLVYTICIVSYGTVELCPLFRSSAPARLIIYFHVQTEWLTLIFNLFSMSL